MSPLLEHDVLPPSETMQKFVRYNDKIAYDREGRAHQNIADDYNIPFADDAGYLLRHNEALIFSGGSSGYDIDPASPNAEFRQETVKIAKEKTGVDVLAV